MNTPTTALAVREVHVTENLRTATDVAGACRDIVLACAKKIGTKQYVGVEGWQAIAIAHGCIASARDVERQGTGFRAIGEVRRQHDGAILATAEGFVGDDEDTWSQRAEYARRAMAQTRAISRACRSAFAHVVVMMNAGLSTTPAEEVPQGGFDEPQPTRRREDAGQETRESVAAEVGKLSGWRDVKIHFGKNKDKPLGELTPRSREWYVENFEKQIAEGKQLAGLDAKLYAALQMSLAEGGSPPRPAAPATVSRDLENLRGMLEFNSIGEATFLEVANANGWTQAKRMDAITQSEAANLIANMETVIGECVK